MNQSQVVKISAAVELFCGWLDRYGETSYDHQSYFASDLGRSAKALYYRRRLLGTVAVAPMVLSEAFVPSARTLFWKPQRFPIADAHYAMGFAFLAEIYKDDKYYQRAVHFLDVLQETRCPGYDDYGWGYPFDWQTRTGIIKEGTPLITTVPYVYEAFSQVYALDKDPKWLRIMRSIAAHAFRNYRDLETGPDAASCAYTPAPDDPGQVINASAYRAFLLTKAGIELSEPRYLEVAKRNLNFVLASQNARRLLVLLYRWSTGFRRPLPHLLRHESTRKNRTNDRVSSLRKRDRTRNSLLREKFVRHQSSSDPIFQEAKAHRVSPRTLRLRGMHQPGSSFVRSFP